MKVRVYHTGYGCDSGCCGHVVEMEDGRTHFEFTHPDTDDPDQRKEWARDLAETVIRKEWPKCIDSIAWDSLEVDDEDVSDS